MHIYYLIYFLFLFFFNTKITRYFASLINSRIYFFYKLLFKYIRNSYNSSSNKKYIDNLYGFIFFYKDILWFYNFYLVITFFFFLLIFFFFFFFLFFFFIFFFFFFTFILNNLRSYGSIKL